MGPFVTPDMVTRRFGPFSDEQEARLPWLIADTEAKIGHQRDLPGRIASGRTSVDVVVLVVCELVNDEVRNPLGLRSQSQTTGSFTDHVTFAGNPTGHAPALSKEHQRLLGDRVGGGAFTVRPGGGDR